MKTTVQFLTCCMFMLVSLGAMAAGHTVTITVDQNASCFGFTDGQATANVSGGTGPFTYAWDDAGSSTSAILSGVGAGTYTVTVTDQSDMSTETATCTITEPAQILPVGTSNSPICEGTNLDLSVSTIAGASYLWTGPNSFSTTLQNPSIASVTTAEGGMYTVVVTVGTCSSDPVNVNAVVNPIPVTPAVTTNSPLCGGSTLELNTPTVAGATYMWTGPGGFASSMQNPAIASVTPASAGVYSVMVAVNGCMSPIATTNVVVNQTITPTWDPIPPLCQGDTPPSMPAPSNVGGCPGTWNPGAISTATAGTTTYTWTPSGGCSCVSYGTFSVTVVPPTTPTFVAPSPVCQGEVVPAIQTPSNEGIQGTWNPAVFSSSSPGSVCATFTPDAGVCATTATICLTVNAVSSTTFNPLSAFCAGETAPTLPGVSLEGVTGSWTPAMDNIVSATYTFTPDPGQCASTGTITTTVNAVLALISVTETCDGSNSSYTVEVTLSGGGGYNVIENAPGGIGGSSSGNVWTSNPIPSGTAYDIDFSDVNACGILNVSGVKNCACTTDAGTMNTTAAIFCEGVNGSASHNGDETLDGDDVLSYVLHTGSSGTLGTVIASAASPDFAFAAPMAYGTTYYISAVAGNDDGSGLADLTDPCLSVGIGTPVTWYEYPDVVAFSNSPVCDGEFVQLTATSIPGATYNWTGPNAFVSTMQNPVFNAFPGVSGTYSLTVSDHGCASPAVTTVVTVNAAVTPTFSQIGPYCQGDAIPFPPTTSNNGINGTWSPAINNMVTTTYTFTPTGGQCATTASLTIVINSQVVPFFTPITAFCEGTVAPVLPSASANAISGTWAPGVVDNTASGTYTFTPDPGSCASTVSMTITVHPNPVINAPSATTCPGVDVVLNASGASTYTWSPVTGLNTTTGSSVTANLSNTTTYTVTGTDANGCVGTTNLTVTIGASLSITVSPSNPSICEGGSVVLTGIGAMNYTWSPAAGLSQTTGDGITASPTVTTTYTVTGESSGCIGSVDVVVTVSPIPSPTFSITDATCASNCDGAIVATSVSGGTYSWSSPNGYVSTSQSPTDLCPGIYTLVVTAGGCASAPATATISGPAAINVSLTPTAPSSCTACDGAIASSVNGGIAPYTYSWSGPAGFASAQDGFSNGCTGMYTLLVTDNNGCEESSSVLLENDAIDLDVSGTANTCGGQTGSATATVTGATGNVTYNWSPGGMTTQSVFNLSGGTYTVTVLDGAGCTETGSVTIANTNSPTVTGSSIPSSCGASDGVINATGSGGTAPYQYSIDNGAFGSSATFTGLVQGFHLVKVQDNNGCIGSTNVMVGNSGNLLANAYTTNATCNNSANGSVTVATYNGTAPYTYLWNNGATTQTISNLTPGYYSCTVSDASGCQRSLYTYVSYDNHFYVGYGGYVYDNCGTAELTASVYTYYGSPNTYTFQWSNGATTQTINDVPPGNYTVTVTNANGCTRTASYTVLDNDYAYIKGRVYIDANANCIKDGSDQFLTATITATGPSGNTYSGYASYYDGQYSIAVPNEAGNFTIEVTPFGAYNLDYYTLNCPPAAISLTGNCETVNNVDFAYTATPAQDLAITTYCGQARPGFPTYTGIVYSNPGTIEMDGTVKVDLDPLLQFTGATPSPSVVGGNHLEWNFTDLGAAQQRQIHIFSTVATIENGGTLGTPIDVHATIEPFAGDLAVANNTSDCSRIITGSWDPNMKEVYSPQAHSSGAIDSSGADLFYTVHFQNTGTDTAFTIVVRDTLSPYVDLTTLEMLSSSHHYTWSLQPGRCLEVRFNQILLVDSNRNEPLSHGHFNYRIRTVEDLPLGAQVDNTAGIYFDFNEPVITNTVSSPVVAFASVEEADLLQAIVYPNPNNTGSVRVKLNGMSYDEISFQLMDANGRIVRSDRFSNSPLFDVNLDGLQNGIYFYTITNEQAHRSTGKLIISK